MKKSLLFTVLLFFAFAAIGQTYQVSVSGKAADADNGSPLIGAHAILTNNETVEVQTSITDFDGEFFFDNIEEGNYTFEITYIGYQEISREIKVLGEIVNMGIVNLKEGVELIEVEVSEQVLPALQKGDTTVFNADAYKTLPDASAEDLIEKMPTIQVDEGKVKAQGEDVKQVLVDGKQFFGDDPTAALRNLPAEVIEKIEVFDQQGQQAQFTGFDDGETVKTINIVTKPGMRNGEFGKAFAGYGHEDRYKLGGNINVFDGDQRISLIGMSNNINQQNFSTEDILGVVGSDGKKFGPGAGMMKGGRSSGGGRGGISGPTSSDFLVGQQDGITTSHAAGINFSDEWGEKLEVAASYFFNQSENDSEQLIEQQFFDGEGLNENYDEQNYAQGTNINHRFTGRLEYEINGQNSLSWRPKLSVQTNDGEESTFGQTLLNEEQLNQTNNGFSADLFTLNFSNDLFWKHKFDKDRRTFSVRLNGGVAPMNGESYLLSETFYGGASLDTSMANQFSNLDINSWNTSANLQYTEPVGELGMLMLNYKSSYQQEESTKETLDFDEGTQAYDLFNQGLSNIFSNDYFTHQLGGGYNYRKGKLMLMARANVQYASLVNEQVTPSESKYENSYLNILPMAMMRYSISRSDNFRIFYRSNTELPSIEQLQNVVDNSNPLQLTVGNPALDQAFKHSLFTRYSKTNTEKSSVFFAMFGCSLTNDYIANSTYLSSDENPVLETYEVGDGVQLTRPVNLDGHWDLRSYITYGVPVPALQSNLNIDLSGNFSRTPGLVSEELNYSNSTTWGGGLTLSSNISDRVDFTLSSRSSYNTVSNSLLTTSNTNYFNQNTRLKFNWIFGGDFVFRTDLSHQYYDGLEENFDQNYLLWNISIGKKLLKDNRGEISLTFFDLFDQNNSLTRNVTETFIEDIQTNILQRYVMLNFKYDIRHFGAGS